MGYWAKNATKITAIGAFFASFALAQTYDLPIIFVDSGSAYDNRRFVIESSATLQNASKSIKAS